MDETHNRIIEESTRLFLKYGIRSITMDDVSKELGISKKTLYKYVSNKADLVDQGVKATFQGVMQDLERISVETANAIDELFDIDEYFDGFMRAQHPAMLFQLKKYYLETYGWLDGKKAKFIMDTTLRNLKKGKEQGYYREDINESYIAYIYLSHALVMESEMIPEEICESSGFHKEHVRYHIRGIASEKGLEYLKQKLNKK